MRKRKHSGRGSIGFPSTLATVTGLLILCALSALASEAIRLDFSPTLAVQLREQAEARKVKLAIKRCPQPPVNDLEYD